MEDLLNTDITFSSKRLKICYVINHMAFGGAETQLMRLLLALSNYQHEIHLITLYSSKEYIGNLRAAGVKVYNLNLSSRVNPVNILYLYRVIKSINPDLLHSFLLQANIATRLAKALYPQGKLITSIRNEREGGVWVFPVYKATDRFSTVTTQVCRSGAKKYIDNRAVPEGKMVVLSNGLEMKLIKVPYRSRDLICNELTLDTKSFIWISVGSQRTQKNYVQLIKAFTRTKSYSKAYLLIAGESYQQKVLIKILRLYDVGNRVRLLGGRSDVPKLLKASDAYIQASKWEGFPNAVLEAMAYGVPVVATKVGAIPDLIVNNRTGYIIDTPLVPDIIKSMNRVTELPKETLYAVGEAASNEVKTKYDMNLIVLRWFTLYNQVLNEVGYEVKLP
ncbi:MAG: glycosyltransferase [Balneolales bacterium]